MRESIYSPLLLKGPNDHGKTENRRPAYNSTILRQKKMSHTRTIMPLIFLFNKINEQSYIT